VLLLIHEYKSANTDTSHSGANSGANSTHLLLLWRCVPAAHAAARDKLRLRGGADSGANSGANSGAAAAAAAAAVREQVLANLGLRGGAGVPVWCAALLPSSYPSVSAWLVALAKIVLAQVFFFCGCFFFLFPLFLLAAARVCVSAWLQASYNSGLRPDTLVA